MRRKNERFWTIAGCVTVIHLVCYAGFAAEPETPADLIVNASGLTAGLCVQLGVGDGKLAAELGLNQRFLVQGLETDGTKVVAARGEIQSLSVYGRVSVDATDSFKRLPYPDNFVNLIVVEDPANSLKAGFSFEEALRVLSPRGVLLVGGPKASSHKSSVLKAGFKDAVVANGGAWMRCEKPLNPRMDEWTHNFHGPDNNPVSRDTLVAPGNFMQFWNGPRWGRMIIWRRRPSILYKARF